MERRLLAVTTITCALACTSCSPGLIAQLLSTSRAEAAPLAETAPLTEAAALDEAATPETGGTPVVLASVDPTLAGEEISDPLDEGEGSCAIPYSGAVTIIPVRGKVALHRAVRDRRAVPIVYSTPDTAIYEDGRVLTSNLEGVGEHLNEVGWAQNPMRVLGASARAGASQANYAWRSQSASADGKSKPKRKRRRG